MFSVLQTVPKRQTKSEEEDDDRELQDTAEDCPEGCQVILLIISLTCQLVNFYSHLYNNMLHTQNLHHQHGTLLSAMIQSKAKS